MIEPRTTTPAIFRTAASIFSGYSSGSEGSCVDVDGTGVSYGVSNGSWVGAVASLPRAPSTTVACIGQSIMLLRSRLDQTLRVAG